MPESKRSPELVDGVEGRDSRGWTLAGSARRIESTAAWSAGNQAAECAGTADHRDPSGAHPCER
jgi:hypothetical protein